MKRLLCYIALGLLFVLTSCERVEPNHQGVLMTDYGKNGKSDFHLVNGRVNMLGFGLQLYQVPLYQLRGEFSEMITLKASDNTEFSARPVYSYRVIKEKSIDVVFDNKHIDGTGDFMDNLEDNVIEPRVFDLLKEESRKHHTNELMSDGGSLNFEKIIEEVIKKDLEKRGLELLTFSAQLEFSDKVRERIDSRNEVSTNLTVLDQQIEEQKKRNELEKLKAEQNIIRSQGITDKLLIEAFIDKWDGKTPIYIYDNISTMLKIVK